MAYLRKIIQPLNIINYHHKRLPIMKLYNYPYNIPTKILRLSYASLSGADSEYNTNKRLENNVNINSIKQENVQLQHNIKISTGKQEFCESSVHSLPVKNDLSLVCDNELFTDISQYADTYNEKQARIIFDQYNKDYKLYTKQFKIFIQNYIEYVYTYPYINSKIRLFYKNKAISKYSSIMFKHINIACSENYFTNHKNGILMTHITENEKQDLCKIINMEIKELNSVIEHLKMLKYNDRTTKNRNILIGLLIFVPMLGHQSTLLNFENFEWFLLLSSSLIFHELFKHIIYMDDCTMEQFETVKNTLMLALYDKVTRLNKLQTNITENCKLN